MQIIDNFVTTFSQTNRLSTMEIGKIIGTNLKEFRKKFGYEQEDIAQYLGVDRSTISLYENSQREISIVQLHKIADLFAIELEDLIEPDSANKAANLAFAFRSNGINESDLSSIASFQKVVKNYIRMKKIANEKG